jgi:hypothetical protein
MTKKVVVQLAQSFSEIGLEPEELLRITTTSKYPTCFHAAWVLENTLISFPEAIDYYLPTIIEHIPLTSNPSVQRHLTKLAAVGLRRLITRKTARIFEKEFWKTNLEPIEDCCFQWLVDPDTKPGIKTHCMEILYLLSTRQKWIAQELPFIIENQINLGSPALKAKGNEILKSLRRQKQSHKV